MSGRRNRIFSPGAALLLFFSGCGFADLRPVNVNTIPAIMNAVLPSPYSPVVAAFSAAMERTGAEELLQITYSGGSVQGNLSWKGTSLVFIPAAGWQAGVRYVLVLSGSAYALDGREIKVEKYLPFYALTMAGPPLVESFVPPDGASTGVSPDETQLVLRFSRAMDRLSTETALVFEDAGKKTYIWEKNDTLLRVRSENNLAPWTVYRWSLGEGALSREGVPLGKKTGGYFITDSDRLAPCVSGVYPMMRSGGKWLPTGGNIESDLGPGQGIGIDFNKAMNEKILRALRFDPSLPGRAEFLSPSALVYIPDRNPEPETAYTLTIGADAEDTAGIKMGNDFTVHFTADIPFLKALSFAADGSPVFGAGPGGIGAEPSVVQVPIDIAGGNVLRFTLRFSLPFDMETKKNAVFRISLEPFFPGDLMQVSLRFAEWLSGDMLRMEWEGLKAAAGEAHYYKLVVPGGKGGIISGEGMYLAEDVTLYLEAVE
ncbi:MAG: Ig-like domain-containing protein [Treponema sp.]|jgi:hypothetical protein|nr:Ig-like domain-containing protein [Treponema sp.]